VVVDPAVQKMVLSQVAQIVVLTAAKVVVESMVGLVC
jgi:hypothetical protein